MKITVIGAGNGGTAIAADLSIKGHEVTLLKTSRNIHNEHFKFLIKNNGLVRYTYKNKSTITKIQRVTTSFEEAFSSEPQIIILFVQTNYHENVIEKMSKYLKDNQIILLEPGYLSTAYIKKYCKNKEIIIVEAESSPIDCRITEPGHIKVFYMNVRNPLGVFPLCRRDEAMAILNLLDYKFVSLDSVVEAALHNPNLIVHTVGAIMSIPRIEYTKGDYWMYKEVFTPSVWNLVEKLDEEKMKILSYLGLKAIPYVEACKFRNSVNLGVDAKAVFFDYAYNYSPPGPSVSNSRYVTEDVPEGLVLLESLGKILNINTPIATALIDIASAALCVDFRKDGRTVERLGEENIKEILSSIKQYI